MIVKPEARGAGIGRLLMADLIDTPLRMQLDKVTIEAKDIGRYVWARIGFIPDRGLGDRYGPKSCCGSPKPCRNCRQEQRKS
jgi:GNAT superfamily N-acetyltransferase